MKRIYAFITLISSVVLLSCSSKEDLKEISGSFEFNEIGKHSFVINAEHIEATIVLEGSNKGEVLILDNITLDRNAEYTAIIGDKNSDTELLNNLVVEYEAKPGITKDLIKNGRIKIDWIGFD